MHRLRRLLVLPLLALAAACTDPNALGDATVTNVVDTVTLAALEGTPVSMPSGFHINLGAVRTDQTVDFEFAYNVRQLADGSYQRVLVPRAALGISTSSAEPGLQRREEPFEEITRAPSNGYVTDSAVPVQLDERYLVRSRVVCTSLGVPLYGKLRILGFEDSTITFEVLADRNCGFKDLLPGLPEE